MGLKESRIGSCGRLLGAAGRRRLCGIQQAPQGPTVVPTRGGMVFWTVAVPTRCSSSARGRDRQFRSGYCRSPRRAKEALQRAPADFLTSLSHTASNWTDAKFMLERWASKLSMFGKEFSSNPGNGLGLGA